MFIIHGDKDPVVPYKQSVELHKKLLSEGVISEFMTVKNGAHGKFTPEEKKEFRKRMFAFLEELGL